MSPNKPGGPFLRPIVGVILLMTLLVVLSGLVLFSTNTKVASTFPENCFNKVVSGLYYLLNSSSDSSSPALEPENSELKPPSSKQTEITVNFNAKVKSISPKIFGQSIGTYGGHLFHVFDAFDWYPDIYQPNYLSLAQSTGFTNLRWGGIYNESNWNWDRSGVPDDKKWMYLDYEQGTKAGLDVTGDHPIMQVKTSGDLATNIATAKAWQQDALAKGYKVKFWEIGNETNNLMDKNTYAQNATAICQALKSQDSETKCLFNTVPSWLDGDGWNKTVKSVAGKYLDGAIIHLYSPDSYFDTNYFYYNDPKEYTVNLDSTGNYTLGIAARLVNPINGCQPIVSISVDGQEVLKKNVYHTWQEFSVSAGELKSGSHQITVRNAGDSFNSQACQFQTALFYANLYLKNSSGKVTSIPVWDKKDWTYSFFGSAQKMGQEVNYIKRIFNKPVYVTEFGFNYVPQDQIYSSAKSLASGTYGFAKEQYDWRSNLFIALLYNELIKNGADEAAIWSDTGTGYWRYADEKGNPYPLYYLIKNYVANTGDTLVQTKVTNAKTYSSEANISAAVGPVSNIPYLSVVASKDNGTQKYFVTIVNSNQDENEKVNLKFAGANFTVAQISTLSGKSLESHPFKDGQAISPIGTTGKIKDNALTLTLPKHSVTFVEVK